MEDAAWREYALQVVIGRSKTGPADVEIRVRMRDLTWFTVARQDWPQGAPTPGQLDLLAAAVVDELHKHVLAVCGVQGVLLAHEELEAPRSP
jgi:hypothetical protein